MKEIVTLQFGQQSNYLGTHFWNTQESYFTYSGDDESPVNHDILFRPGIAPDGADTFTPRLVLYDLKGAFGSMRKINALYEIEESSDPTQSLWAGSTAIQKQIPITPSKYQQHLDQGLTPTPLTTKDVRYWSDFNRVYYHPKSLSQLYEYEFRDQLRPFEKWDVGEDLFHALDREHDLLDRDLRPFVEEADHLQGLQVFSTVDDAWAGFAGKYLERLRDEYGKTSIWFWGLESTASAGSNRNKNPASLANSARALQEISQQASVYIPVANIHTSTKLPAYLQADSTSAWHTSAIQAAAIESITLPTRLRAGTGQQGRLDYFEQALTNSGRRRVAKLGLDLTRQGEHGPVDLATTTGVATQGNRKTKYEDEEEEEGKLTANYDMDFFTREYHQRSGTRGPRHNKAEHVFGKVEASRGREAPETKSRESQDADERVQGHGYGSFGVDRQRVQSYQIPLGFPLLDSYPDIWHITATNPYSANHDDGNDKFKDQDSDDKEEEALSVAKLDMRAGLATTSGVAKQIRQVKQTAVRFMALEEREGFADALESICEEYEEGWSSGSDDDEDE